MIEIIITENQGGQRLDRFLKKYFDKAPLSLIYKMIRKDVKVNGKRSTKEAVNQAGDRLAVYLSEEEAKALQTQKKRVRAKRQFSIAYEDENLLIAEKPFGLLTHGDKTEKKNHLANQVVDYLIEKGAGRTAGQEYHRPCHVRKKRPGAAGTESPDPGKGCHRQILSDHRIRPYDPAPSAAGPDDQR